MKVIETFISINGEGQRAGQLAVFVRFKGCNLNCSYCDTRYANEAAASFTEMSPQAVADHIRSTGVKNVTLTGGEPLLQPEMGELLEILAAEQDLRVEIETNGSVSLESFAHIENGPSFTMDYKQPGSGMEAHMCLENFYLLKAQDTVKFVSGSREDLEKAKEIIERYDLTHRCHVYLSPVFGRITPAEIVDFLVENRMNDVNLQLQLHKIIWDPEARGV